MTSEQSDVNVWREYFKVIVWHSPLDDAMQKPWATWHIYRPMPASPGMSIVDTVHDCQYTCHL